MDPMTLIYGGLLLVSCAVCLLYCTIAAGRGDKGLTWFYGLSPIGILGLAPVGVLLMLYGFKLYNYSDRTPTEVFLNFLGLAIVLGAPLWGLTVVPLTDMITVLRRGRKRHVQQPVLNGYHYAGYQSVGSGYPSVPQTLYQQPVPSTSWYQPQAVQQVVPEAQPQYVPESFYQRPTPEVVEPVVEESTVEPTTFVVEESTVEPTTLIPEPRSLRRWS